jgi:myo-inositol 2-dehydrogenase / D-chiro-inositol 1-dehydrogenase
MIGVSLIGAGRMGKLHAKNLLANPNAKIVSVYDPHLPSAQAIASRAGCDSRGDVNEAISAKDCQAVVICSPTNTHIDFILRAIEAGKFVFCEKPIDLDLDRARTCVEQIRGRAGQVMIGFHRRFDSSQAKLREVVRSGGIGVVEQMTINCRDPAPPPPEYIRSSGGIFRDMMIHDFDQARSITGIDFVSVFAHGEALFDKAAAQYGDRDTATAQLFGPRGETCTIFNSRRCVYGFEQRIEVFGSKGTIAMENPRALFISQFTAGGEQLPPLMPFFPERYESAYRQELNHFVSAIETQSRFEVTIHDGLLSLTMANAAHESATKHELVSIINC